MIGETVKIYLAARFTGGRGDPDHHNYNLATAGTEPYPHLLESYHYAKEGKLDAAIRKAGIKVFLDSGAFSMFTQGVKVNLDEYARYIESHTDMVEFASNVDAIGAGREAESYANQKYMEQCKLPVPIYPVHHARDDDRWLVKYLDEGYDYIFLGGMVPETTGYLYEWLDRIWDKYLALPDGTARVKIHGFGLTTWELMERYPWYSVDSTSWVMISSYGNILVWVDGRARAISVSTKSPNMKMADKSYWTMDAVSQSHMRSIVEAEGFTIEDLAENYGVRDKWNIRFFRRYMERMKPQYRRRDVTLF